MHRHDGECPHQAPITFHNHFWEKVKIKNDRTKELAKKTVDSIKTLKQKSNTRKLNHVSCQY